MERRLAAILAADVVGYSRLMGADEEETLATLNAHREVIDRLVVGFHGRVFGSAGDSVIAEFVSPVEAVRCAVEIQREIEAGNAILSEDRRMHFRIGVNLGDVMVEGDNLFGDTVNVAARLEGLAKAGGVCVSGTVFDYVRNKVGQEFEALGDLQVKNIDQPVRVYRITLESDVAESEAHRATAVGPIELKFVEKPAIAVLPFENMSGDPEQEYFSDGLAEDIITALSHWRSFPVVARNSSFSYKGQNIRVQTVSEELGARYILEGSVRKAGSRLRITAQLIDAQTGHHVWAERFDRQLEDVFDIQDEITNRIAATIVPELEHFEHRRSTAKRTEDLDAWDYYLRGMETFHDETCDGTASSIRMFQAAVDLDPNYCDAWARLGWAYGRSVMLKCGDDPDATLRLGFEASRKAVALDYSSAEAHMGLGECHIWAEETDVGLEEAQIALELNPSFAIAAMSVGNRLDLVGRAERGIAEMERSLKLNPRDPNRWRYMAYLSRAYIGLKEYQRAADWARQAARLRPDLPEALFRCAVCVAHLDEVEEAKALLERCRAIDLDYLLKMRDWRPYADHARNDHFLSGLRRHGLLP
jgi:adenylate cyclase